MSERLGFAPRYRDALRLVFSGVLNFSIWYGGIPSGQRRAVDTERLNMGVCFENHLPHEEKLDSPLSCPVECHQGITRTACQAQEGKKSKMLREYTALTMAMKRN